jgi:hypothetical protein
MFIKIPFVPEISSNDVVLMNGMHGYGKEALGQRDGFDV